jgi:hypothetical protein
MEVLLFIFPEVIVKYCEGHVLQFLDLLDDCGTWGLPSDFKKKTSDGKHTKGQFSLPLLRKGKAISLAERASIGRKTNVSHESKGENLVRMLSMPRVYFP